MGQIQTLGRMATLLGGIAVGLPSGVLAAHLGPRGVFAVAMALPLIVAVSAAFVPRWRDAPTTAPWVGQGALGGGRARLVVLVGLGYAAFGVALEMVGIPAAQEIRAGRLGGAPVILARAHGHHALGDGRRGRHLHLSRDA